jgi:hypothetical protein
MNLELNTIIIINISHVSKKFRLTSISRTITKNPSHQMPIDINADMNAMTYFSAFNLCLLLCVCK